MTATAPAPNPSARKFCVGFVFDGPGSDYVALVKKARPTWQAGLLNGLGGKIADGEDPTTAMAREFKEEAGIDIPLAKWRLFAIMAGKNGDDDETELYCFTAHHKCNLKQMTDEPVAWYTAAVATDRHAVVSGLSWMIPMAMDDSNSDMLAVCTGCWGE